jgi:hypothetical protein
MAPGEPTSGPDPLDELAEEFLARYRARGEAAEPQPRVAWSPCGQPSGMLIRDLRKMG